MIAHGHPQAVLHRLLGPENLNLDRAEVVALGEPDAGQTARAALLSQALRPADTTDAWADLDPDARDAVARLGLDGLALAEAADEREEALVAAVALREALAEARRHRGPGHARPGARRPGRRGVAALGHRGGGFGGAGAGRQPGRPARPAGGRVRRRLARSSGGRDPGPADRAALASDGPPRPAARRRGARRGGPGDRPAARAGPGAGLRRPAQRSRGRARRAAGAPAPGEAAARRISTGTSPRTCSTGSIWFSETFPGPDGAGACDLVETAARHREACDRLIAGPEDAPEMEADGSLSCLDALFDDLEMAEPGLMPGGSTITPPSSPPSPGSASSPARARRRIRGCASSVCWRRGCCRWTGSCSAASTRASGRCAR